MGAGAIAGQSDMALLGGVNLDSGGGGFGGGGGGFGAGGFDDSFGKETPPPPPEDKWGLINQSNVVNLDNLNLAKGESDAPAKPGSPVKSMAQLKAKAEPKSGGFGPPPVLQPTPSPSRTRWCCASPGINAPG